MINTPAPENLQPSVLLFFPTLKTPEEQSFWENFARALKSRGYKPVQVSFLRADTKALPHAQDVLIPTWRMIETKPEYSHLGDENHPLLKRFLSVSKHSAAVELLIEYAGSIKSSTSTQTSRLQNYNKYKRSALCYVHLLLTILSEHKPAKAVVNNDTHPLHYTARLCVDSLEIPAIHSERSPFVNQWFEPEGYYGNSEIEQFLSDGRWREPGGHETFGNQVVEKLKTAPAGHRAGDPTTEPEYTLKGTRSKPVIFLALDHALATGWSLANHPLRQTHYPVFDEPEKAVSYFADLGERLGAEVWIKTHPSEPKDASFIAAIRSEPRVTYLDGGFEDALANCNAVVCFLTKTAIAGLALGKPVVTIGSNIAALSGLTYDCRERGEIEGQVKAALSSRAPADREPVVKRFLGYLDQNFFIANDLSNAGARRLLDLHFPERMQAKANCTCADKPNVVGNKHALARPIPAAAGDASMRPKSVTFYPVIDREDALIDVISRTAWFLSSSTISRFIIPVANEALARMPWRVASGMDPSIADRFDELKSRTEFRVCSDEEALRRDMDSSVAILCWNATRSQWLFDEEKRKANWLKGKRVWRVDPTTDRNEGGLYIEAGFKLVDNLKDVIENNRRKFIQLSGRLGEFERAYLLATGPSVQHYSELNHEGALGIVCNSVILDETLMQTLKPQIVVFADPIFHFGPSEYAAAFRQSLRRAAARHDFTIVIPVKYHQIFVSSFPELESRMIAIPFNQGKNFNLDLREEFEVKVTANILTFLMVPLATTFASRIEFLGCDGRPLNENNYFWKHNPKTQINDKMSNIREIHPAFFNIDYNDYYTSHCDLLDQQIREGEDKGKGFACMAHSHIPALNARMVRKGSRFPSAPPRLLIIDSTKVGSPSATGQIKKRLLGKYPAGSVMQILALHEDIGSMMPLVAESKPRQFENDQDLIDAVKAFRPDVTYYRPLEQHPSLAHAARLVLDQLKLPMVTHIMDDWPEAVAATDPKRAEVLNQELRYFFSRSRRVLSISEKMSETFRERYGVEFEPIANGIDPDLCNRLADDARAVKSKRDTVIMRYTGALAKNMTFNTILHIARVVDQLQEQFPLRFEIYTMPMWRKEFALAAKGLKGVDILESVPDDEYERLLAEADILVLGYNFDPDSLTYIQYSIPNKLPEYLGSGAPVLAVGPEETAAMELLSANDLGVRITSQDTDELAAAISRLATNPEIGRRIAEEAQAWTFKNRDIRMISKRFISILTEAAAPDHADIVDHSRCKQASVDETGVVAHMLNDRTGRERVMLDVGAHYGTSAQYFHNLGWSIHCFEPDPKNRVHLLRRFRDAPNVIIDPRAVSDKPATGVSFFSSEESTGISGLSAFRETHRESAKVDITTVSDIIRDRNISRVDFLKIDVEGFDFGVLKGVPWDKLKPDVVECEFEDAKTVPLGHTWKEIADFLCGHGYHVYVSEWHPIIRYGTPHDWRRVFKYPGPHMDSSAWGNFLAFREDPGMAAVQAAFDACVKFRQPAKAGMPHQDKPKSDGRPPEKTVSSPAKAESAKPATNSGVSAGPAANVNPIGIIAADAALAPPAHDSRVSMLQKTPPQLVETPPAAGRMWYSAPAHRIRQVSPQLFTLLQFARRSFVHVIARPHLLLLLLAAAGAAVWVSMDPQFAASRGWILIGGSLALVALGLLYVAAKAQAHAATLHIEAANLQAEVAALKAMAAQTQHLAVAGDNARADAVSSRIAQLQSELAIAKASNSKLAADLAARSAATANDISKLSGAMAAMPELTQKVAKLSGAVAAVPQALEPKIKAASDAAEKLSADLASVSQRITALDTERQKLASEIKGEVAKLSGAVA
ncbi:MAG: FkbM family methyltransferase, partial [Hyphomonas sp.]